MENNTPKTLLEAVRYYTDLDVCHAYMVAVKWPDGKIACPKCGGNAVGEIKSRRMFQCRNKDCKKQFSAKIGTIFEDSPLGLDKWFVAVWCIANAKNGISSWELHRALGVTQKTAWFMLHRVRLAMQTKSFVKMDGMVESDETFIGGKAKFMHASKRSERIQGRGTVGKTIVHGFLQRGSEEKASQVRLNVVADQTKKTLQGFVRQHVMPGAFVFTDTLRSYVGLSPQYVHGMVDHSAGVYVDGKVHTNGMENFWSLVKRCLKGTYVAVAPWHLFRYLDEEAFRFNERKVDDGDRFQMVMAAVVGKRLTYKEVAGKAEPELGLA
jgi:transposase-like protein